VKRRRISDYLGKYWTGAEAMYGVIIVMTFTSTLRNSKFDTQEIYSTVVFSALYCCIAWGVTDGFFYAWEDAYNAKTRRLMIEDSKRSDGKPMAYALVKDELDDTILSTINEANRKKLYEIFIEYLSHTEVKKEDRRSILRNLPHYLWGTSLLSVGAGVLVLLPFFVIRSNIPLALNTSNLAGVVALFGIGFFRTPDEKISRKLASGIISALLGLIIAGVTIALGG
jgi:hypothetical protein